ncbi:Uncharacterised protein [Candidatus Anstonella stagnisolia]|nr:Uncharacterised protein [Candidatus Anstonella stagnisolia]
MADGTNENAILSAVSRHESKYRYEEIDRLIMEHLGNAKLLCKIIEVGARNYGLGQNLSWKTLEAVIRKNDLPDYLGMGIIAAGENVRLTLLHGAMERNIDAARKIATQAGMYREFVALRLLEFRQAPEPSLALFQNAMGILRFEELTPGEYEAVSRFATKNAFCGVKLSHSMPYAELTEEFEIFAGLKPVPDDWKTKWVSTETSIANAYGNVVDEVLKNMREFAKKGEITVLMRFLRDMDREGNALSGIIARAGKRSEVEAAIREKFIAYAPNPTWEPVKGYPHPKYSPEDIKYNTGVALRHIELCAEYLPESTVDEIIQLAGTHGCVDCLKRASESQTANKKFGSKIKIAISIAEETVRREKEAQRKAYAAIDNRFKGPGAVRQTATWQVQGTCARQMQ